MIKCVAAMMILMISVETSNQCNCGGSPPFIVVFPSFHFIACLVGWLVGWLVCWFVGSPFALILSFVFCVFLEMNI
jgi:F0F1-type ATP synthase assembly protein I